MKRRLVLLFITIIVVCLNNVKAQNLAFYFELIPEAELPHLKPDLRKGMVGLYELGQRPAQVPNLLNGICVLDTLSNDFLSMHSSDASTLTIKMLENKVDTTSILAVVHSVKTLGTNDSNIAFFTNTWSKIATERFIELPSLKDFYKQNDKVSFEEFSKYCIPLLISYSIEDEKLIATIDPEKYLTVEIYKQISSAINFDPIVFVWDGNRYQSNPNY